MSNEAVSLAETEVTDEQVDKFFNGEDANLPEAEPEPEQQEAEVQPEPEQKAEPQPEHEDRERFVPHGALHEERMRRKELQQQLEENAAKTQKMEQAFQKFQQRLSEQARPSYDDDPLEFIRQENEQLKSRLQEYDNRFSEQDNEKQAQEQQQRFVAEYSRQAAEFASKTPEFTDAYNHLMSSRLAELKAAGYNDTQAQHLIAQEEAMIVAKAFDDEVNPGERIFALAKARGFTAKTPVNNDAEKMEALKKGAEASKTLSQGTAKSELTLETLADLDDEEFDKAWEKMVG